MIKGLIQLFFFIGYNTVVLSGNFETLFLGWEILGISSFLLISFYRDRYLPVVNSLKVNAIYRIADVGLIMAMWLIHHLWGMNVSFIQLDNAVETKEVLYNHSNIGIFLSITIVVAAIAKSAQIPFSNWLPRAMEGPTPSSAIFYGALSVHIGVFLLLRTYPIWSHQLGIRVLIIIIGVLSAIVATGIARVQSSIKAQVAYASIVQIGIMFVEMGLGWTTLVLFHFAGNAFLRAYQLLVSPSSVTYLIKEQFYQTNDKRGYLQRVLPKGLNTSLYILSLKEANLDFYAKNYVWKPLQRFGRLTGPIDRSHILKWYMPIFLLASLLSFGFHDQLLEYSSILSVLFVLVALGLILKSYTELHDARSTWILLILSHFLIVEAVYLNGHFPLLYAFIYLTGVICAGGLGFIVMQRLRLVECTLTMHRFHGYAQKHGRMAFLFLLACLGLSGFPITPTFIGEDLVFVGVEEDQFFLAALIAFAFILDGLAIMRLYARLFLGSSRHSSYNSL